MAVNEERIESKIESNESSIGKTILKKWAKQN